MYDIIIIGGGPSGISASIYAASRGLNVLVLEKNKIGGMIKNISMVTHYTGINEAETGHSFANRIKKQAEGYGIEIIYEKVVATSLKEKVKTVKTESNAYEAKAVIIASGTSAKKLGLPNEEKYLQKGLYQNAQRDHEYYKDKTVVVVGGSDGACKEAIFLSNYAKEVHIVHHSEVLGAIAEFTSIINNKDNIKVHLNSSVNGFSGEDKVSTISLKNSKTEELEEIKADELGVFVHIGANPNVEVSNELEMEDGYFKTNDMCETNIAGVYAVGDVRNTQVRQVSTAVADGTKAAIKAFQYIKTL